MFYGFKNQVFAFITCSPLSHIYISTGNSISAFSIGLLLLIWHSFSGWILQFYAKNSDRFLSSGTNLCTGLCAIRCFLLWKRNRTGSWNTGTIYHLDTSWLTEGFLSSSFNTLPASTLFFFFCCCVRARRAEKWMKDVLQTEVPEMWQNVVGAIHVVLDYTIKWLFMKMVILEKRNT